MNRSRSNEQLDLFSTNLHWQKLSKKRCQQILEQLADLLLTCVKQQNLTEKEPLCQEK